MIIAVVWACLMTVSALMPAVKHSHVAQLPDLVYFYISMTNLVEGAGMICCGQCAMSILIILH